MEKLVDRADLLAFGVLHWRDCVGRKDLEWALEILGEEFARAEVAGEPLEELRACLAERGVRVPEVTVHTAAADHLATTEKASLPKQERVSRLPTNDETVHRATAINTQEQESSDLARVEGCAAHRKICTPKAAGPTGSGWWRGWPWNRVPPAIEQAIRERFAQGWSKSRLAREFRLNRRTVIRICAVR